MDVSIYRIPLSASVIWALHTTATPPQPPPQVDELRGPIGVELSIIPLFVKTCFWTAGLAEIVVILTNNYPATLFSKYAAAVLACSPSTPDDNQISWCFFFGYIFAVSGGLIRRNSYRHMGQMFTFEVSLRRNHKLVTTGPYSYVRHPGYSGGALALLGALMCHTTSGSWVRECSGLFQHSWAGYLIAACWVTASIVMSFVVARRVEQEDAILKGRFGPEWEAWARNVPYRLIPRIY